MLARHSGCLTTYGANVRGTSDQRLGHEGPKS